MRRTILPHLALAAVLLTSCSGEPAPKEPDSTESGSPQPTATPAPLPEAATQETAEGAASFVDYYLDVLNYATATGDTSTVLEMSDAQCESCSQFAETVGGIYSKGGRITGGEWSAGKLTVSQQVGYWTVTGEVRTAGGSQQDTRDSTARPASETTARIEFVLQHDGTNWALYSFAGSGA